MTLKKKLLEIISTNITIKESVTFREHLKLYSYVNKLSDSDIERIIEMSPPKTNPKAEAILRKGLAVASLAFPIPGLSLAISYLVDINRYKCVAQVEKNGGEQKSLGFAKCRYAASLWAVNYVKSEIEKCPKTKNPKKCRKKMYKLLKDVSVRAVKSKGKLNWALAKERERLRKGALK